ncbi:response regulator [Pseudobacteriovorax antillogorgiicola]|uniref:Response regulator receiver domain-containing protein n=1 Tax=Pseudobacteriovorax antillogorgiicola TaxID=1513793 RepID=A0A1Y6CL58_9BACT|nr:response regulator [Pseudobacteriovorax antillogorgiicola]TCS45456.1 response regulator receiver domain-containing protein [Pseudobacteriovorax antillogorgiicola]SMF74718.1 Response regulator receiver domain-containing protein [Pseudobacteriovorax antillogorgiicola]
MTEVQNQITENPPKFEFSDTPSRILIIEDDPTIHSVIADPIKNTFPYVSFYFCTSGEEAWQKAQQETFDLIITDWRLAGELSGLRLVNRFRSHSHYRHIPMLIISGYLQEADFNLMQEFNFTSPLLKPFRAQLLVRSVKDVFSEARWFFQQQKNVAELLQDLKDEQDMVRLDQKIEVFLDSCPRPVPMLLLCSRLLREMFSFEQASRFAFRAQQYRPGALNVDCELGKIFLGLGDVQQAEKHLKRSFDRSPNNLERLCDLGRLNLEELDTDQAQHYFNRAAAIDPDSEDAQHGLTLSHQLDHFFKHNNPSNIPETFAGLLNAIGVGLIRSGDLEGGINHYQAALGYISDHHVKALVCFNLGLGYLRFSQYDDAKDWLDQSLKHWPEYEKCRCYLDRVRKCLAVDNQKTLYCDDGAAGDDDDFPNETLQAEFEDESLSPLDH